MSYFRTRNKRKYMYNRRKNSLFGIITLFFLSIFLYFNFSAFAGTVFQVQSAEEKELSDNQEQRETGAVASQEVSDKAEKKTESISEALGAALQTNDRKEESTKSNFINVEPAAVETLPALRTLYENASTKYTDTWEYVHQNGGGTLTLKSGGSNFTLKNREDGLYDGNSIPIQIVVQANASNLNLTFNNINIKRPDVINTETTFFSIDSVNNSVIFINGRSTIITLSEGSRNIINGYDSKVLSDDIGCQRSGIYLYTDLQYGSKALTIKRENESSSSASAPTLGLSYGGINTASVPGTTGTININSGKLELTNEERYTTHNNQNALIGSVAHFRRTSGSTSINISGGEIVAKRYSGQGKAARGAIIGSGYIGAKTLTNNMTVAASGSLSINISGGKVSGLLDTTSTTSKDNFAAVIGTGAVDEGGSFKAVNITISGGEVDAVIINASVTNSAVIGVSSGEYLNNDLQSSGVVDEINIKVTGGKVRAECKGVNTNSNKNYSSAIGVGYGHGKGYGAGKLSITLSGGDIIAIVRDSLGSISNSVGIGGGKLENAEDGKHHRLQIFIEIVGDVKVQSFGSVAALGGRTVGRVEGKPVGTISIKINSNTVGGVKKVPFLMAESNSSNSFLGTVSGNVEFAVLNMGILRPDNETDLKWKGWRNDVDKILNVSKASDRESVYKDLTLVATTAWISITIPDGLKKGDLLRYDVNFIDNGNNVYGSFTKSNPNTEATLTEVPINDSTNSNDLMVAWVKNIPVVNLESLNNSNSTFGTNWSYNSGTKTLRLMRSDDFILSNRADASSNNMASVGISIVVEEMAYDINLILRNISIKRSDYINTTTAFPERTSEQNAPIIVKSRLGSIILAEGSKNRINAEDVKISNSTASQRAGIYIYNGDNVEWDIKRENESKGDKDLPQLNIDKGGINTLSPWGIATIKIINTKIVFNEGIRETNYAGHTGALIGHPTIVSLSAVDKTSVGELKIEIKGSDLTLNTIDDSGGDLVLGSLIGGGYIKFDYSSSLNVNLPRIDIDILDSKITGHSSAKRAAAIGVGKHDGTGGNKYALNKFNLSVSSSDIALEMDGIESGNDATAIGISAGETYNYGTLVANNSIKISGKSKIRVQGVNYGIRGNVVIAKEGGTLPDIVATTKGRNAFVKLDGTSGAIESQLGYLELDTPRTDWGKWEDDKEKNVEVVSSSNNQKKLREDFGITGGVTGIFYTVPNEVSAGVSNVNIKFVNSDSKEITGSFFVVDSPKLDSNIKYSNSLDSVKVFFKVVTNLPPLWTLVNNGVVDGDSVNWEYTPNTGDSSGKLRLIGASEFLLRNNSEVAGDNFKPEAPISIVVEKEATGSTLTFKNVDIINYRANFSEEMFFKADDERNAPLMIKAETTTIILAEGSNNKINGMDMKAKDKYIVQRASIYLYASDINKQYSVNIEREDNTSGASKPTLELNWGGINTHTVTGGSKRTKINVSNVKLDVKRVDSEDSQTRNIGALIGTRGLDKTVVTKDGGVDITFNSSEITASTNFITPRSETLIGAGLVADGAALGNVVIKNNNSVINANAHRNTGSLIGFSSTSDELGERNGEMGQIEIVNDGGSIRASKTNDLHLEENGAIIGGSYTSTNMSVRSLKISLNSGDIEARATTKGDNSTVAIGVGSVNNFQPNRNLSTSIKIGNEAKVIANGGFSGIGGGRGARDVAVDIYGASQIIASSYDNNAINPLNNLGNFVESLGSASSGYLNQLNFGENRTGSNWFNWNDEVDKQISVYIVNNVKNELVLQATLLGGVKSYAYTLPGIVSSEIKTKVRVNFSANGKGGNEYLWSLDTEEQIIIPQLGSVRSINVVYSFIIPVPPLWTLHNGEENFAFSSWNYVWDNKGGTLRLTAADSFTLRNNSETMDDPFVPEVPMHIIVEESADEATIIMENMDIVRSGSAKSNIPNLYSTNEAIAPFFIKANNIKLLLAEGSKNKINAYDSALTESGYRTAIYMYTFIDNISNLNISRADLDSLEEPPTLTTFSGGINAYGDRRSYVYMTLGPANYELFANASNIIDGIAFGGFNNDQGTSMFVLKINGPTDDKVKPLSFQAIGSEMAIGVKNGDLSNSGIYNNVDLWGAAFTDDVENIVKIRKNNSFVAGRANLDKSDKWDKLHMRQYDDDSIDWQEFMLPRVEDYNVSSISPTVSFIRSSPNLTPHLDDRFTFRISRYDEEKKDYEVRYLAHSDGTGSTLEVLPANGQISNESVMYPRNSEFVLNIPAIILQNNVLKRTLSMPTSETRSIVNDSFLPIAVDFDRYSIKSASESIDEIEFSRDDEEFNRAESNNIKAILLKLIVEKADESGYVNFPDGNSRALFLESAGNYSELVSFQGFNGVKKSAVDIKVNGEYSSEFLRSSVNHHFTSTVYLRWRVKDFMPSN